MPLVAAKQRRQGRIGVDHAMAEALRDLEADAVAAGGGHGQAARRDDHAIGARGAARRLHAEGACRPRDIGDGSIELDLDALRARERHQAVADVLRLVRSRKQLAGFFFERERDLQIVLEEGVLLAQRPRPQHAAQHVRRRVGDEPIGRRHSGEHVAAAAAADQDLAAAVPGALDQGDARAGGRGERGSHQSRGAGANHGHRRRRHQDTRAAEGTAGSDFKTTNLAC